MKLIYIGDSGGISGVLQRAMEGAALTNLRCGRSGSNELAVVDAGIFKGRTPRGRKRKGRCKTAKIHTFGFPFND